MSDEKETTSIVLHAPGAISVSAHAHAERAKATALAKFHVALMARRDFGQVRSVLLREMEQPALAERVEYSVPRAGGRITGPSIHLARAVSRAMRNLDEYAEIVSEDDETRTVKVTVTDLEANNSHSLEFTLRKVMERRDLRNGQVAVGTRVTSDGRTVFLVEVSEQELLQAQRAQEARAFRSCILHHCPSWLVDEALSVAKSVRGKNVDPEADVKRVIDDFDIKLRITPENLAEYLGHPAMASTPDELDELRGLFTALMSGEVKWRDVMREREKSGDAAPTRRSPVAEKLDQKRAAAASKKPSNGSPAEPRRGSVGNIKFHTWTRRGERWHGEWEDTQEEMRGVVSCAPGGGELRSESGPALTDDVARACAEMWRPA